MRVNWVYTDTYQLSPEHDIDRIKKVGPSWGSWQTWRSCSTDNVLCHDLARAKSLIGRAFQAVCNFYVPRSFYQDLGRPVGVKLYDGQFDLEMEHVEDIVAMHLASQCSDIVLLAGFSLRINQVADPLEAHKIRNYHGLVRSIIFNSPTVQWVAVDHTSDIDPAYESLENLSCDHMVNVLTLLN